MIYFIQDTRTNAIKIGFTSGESADNRLSALQTGNPGQLVLLMTMEGEQSAEAELHRKFSSSRIAGEWFHPAADLVQFMLKMCHHDAWSAGIDQHIDGEESYKRHMKTEEYREWAQELSETFVQWCLSGSAIGPSSGRQTPNIRCPNCGSDYTHIEQAGTITGSDGYEAIEAYHGTISIDRTGNRRSGIKIVFSCESCPILFALVVQQHKGINYLEIIDKDGVVDGRPELAILPEGFAIQ